MLLAKNVASTLYEHVPKETLEISKNSILDTLGVILGASGTLPGCRDIVELVKEAGGKPESSIIGFGGKVPAWMAAFANGSMAHGLDYDDIHSKVVVHPGACVVPAALATAERIGQVNGRDFLTAVTLGIDMACRMGLAITWERDWHLSPVLGAFACAATAGKLLRLEEDKLLNSLGIALCQAAGTMELNYGIGSNLRGAYPGFAAKAGVLSACMAHRGIDGPKNSLEGKAGLYPVYFRGRYNRRAIIADLGERFEGINLSFKVWPACGIAQSYIGAALKAVTEHDIHPQDIQRITVFVNEVGLEKCQPLEARRKPLSILDAKLSLPFTVAIAATKREVTIADYAPAGLEAPDVLEMAQKVVPQFDERVAQVGAVTQGVVEIETKEGKHYREQVDVARGLPQNPITRTELLVKFRDCARYSARPLSPENVDRVAELIMGLENVANVSDIMKLLS